MLEGRIDELLTEIERLRRALEHIRDTPKRDGILTCQRIASNALAGGTEAIKPREYSLGDPVYYREVRDYLHYRYKRCVYCQSTESLQIEHLTPASRGGGDDIGNLVLACESCNKKKGTQTATEFGFRELALMTLGSVLTGWRKRAEQEQRWQDQIGRV